MMRALLETLKEGEVISLTRLLPVFGYLLFTVVSLYLVIKGETWGNYGEFAMATGGAVVVQLCNKYINSKYNTPLGSGGKDVVQE